MLFTTLQNPSQRDLCALPLGSDDCKTMLSSCLQSLFTVWCVWQKRHSSCFCLNKKDFTLLLKLFKHSIIAAERKTISSLYWLKQGFQYHLNVHSLNCKHWIQTRIQFLSLSNSESNFNSCAVSFYLSRIFQ